MKLYDYVFVPNPDGEWETVYLGAGHFQDESIERKSGPIIVLDLLDIQDIWNAGKERGSNVAYAVKMGNDRLLTAPSLPEYLQSKGISL